MGRVGANWRRFVASSGLVLAGAASAAFGVEGFLLPEGFVDGGVTGLSMILAHLTGVPLFVLIALINLPFLFLAKRYYGYRMVVRGACGVALLACILALFDFPQVTQDRLLTAVFGGIFLGAGIGLAIRGGSVLDGTEVLALVLSRSGTVTVGDVVLGLNLGIFSVAGLTLGIEPALYSVLTYASASRTIDFLIHGVEEYYALTIFSSKADEIRSALIDEMKLAITRIKAAGGLTGQEQEMLFCVVTRLEVARVKALAKEHDKDVFVVVQHVSDVIGGIRRPRVIERMVG